MVLTAAASDIDELGHVNNAVWVQWIQRVATAHWFAVTGAADQARWVWVVVRHEIDYRRALRQGEQAFARTWVPDAAQGARFVRFMEFRDAAGRLLVEAQTHWALIDRASGRPMRVPAELVALFHAPAQDHG